MAGKNLEKIQAIRGMNDNLPSKTPIWQLVEKTLKDVVSSYGYSEIRTPIVENTKLFKRSIGEITDIVEKEMYTFLDRNDESLTLRPEGTASCVRSCMENGLLHNQEQKLWYLGSMFRYERPQKGRYRQFHQFGIEAFGISTPDIDAEIILITARILKKLGLENHVKLQLNSLASTEARNVYINSLIAYLEQHIDCLDDECKHRLHTNPLRILDSKNPEVQGVLEQAPKLREYMDQASSDHFNRLCDILSSVGLKYEINENLVRGLDYYNRTVFEWVTNDLGAQGTICGGGRYDGLVEQLGGKSTPAVGFGLGMERLILLLETVNPELYQPKNPDILMIANDEKTQEIAFILSEKIKNHFPSLQIINDLGSGSFKKKFKKANKLNVKLAIIIADDEREKSQVSIKHMQEDKEQVTISQLNLINYLTDYLK